MCNATQTTITIYSTLQKICNALNVAQLAESEARAVAGGKWEIKG